MTEFKVIKGGKDGDAPVDRITTPQTPEEYLTYIGAVTTTEGPADICIDCNGDGTYPSGSTCLSCFGTGLVAPGDGIAQSPK